MRTVQQWKRERGCGPSPWFAVGRDVFEGSLKAVPTKSQSARPTAKKAVFHAVTSRIKPRRGNVC